MRRQENAICHSWNTQLEGSRRGHRIPPRGAPMWECWIIPDQSVLTWWLLLTLCMPSYSSTKHSHWRSLVKAPAAGSAPTAGWCSAPCFTAGNLSELALPPCFYQLVKLLLFITVSVSSSAWMSSCRADSCWLYYTCSNHWWSALECPSS